MIKTVVSIGCLLYASNGTCNENAFREGEDLPVPKRDSLYEGKKERSLKENSLNDKKAIVLKRKSATPGKKEQPLAVGLTTNLPTYFQTREANLSDEESSGTSMVQPLTTRERVPGLRKGIRMKALIDETITVSNHAEVPVKALVMNGNFKGSYFMGHASLEGDLKRVKVEFNSIILPTKIIRCKLSQPLLGGLTESSV